MARTERRYLREARARAEEVFARAAQADVLARVRDELFALVDFLRSHATLRKGLADAGTPGDAREGIVRDLFSDRLDEHTLDLLARLSREDSMVWRLGAVLEDLAVQAVLAQAEHDGSLPEVEDELFRFARLLESEPRLRSALSDPVLPDANKQAVIDDLLAGRASEATVMLVRHAVRKPGDPVERIGELAERAATRRNRVVVEARTAVRLDDERRDRLGEALARILGREVDLEVMVDPSIVGGVLARVGDEVIDGSVRRKLELAMEQLTG